jgi:hypothetical protein
MPLTWMKGHPGDTVNAESNDWGSSGRRFKSCQPDFVVSQDIGIALNLR